MISSDTVLQLLAEYCPEIKVKSIARLGNGRRWEVFKLDSDMVVRYSDDMTVKSICPQPTPSTMLGSLITDSYRIEIHRYIDGMPLNISGSHPSVYLQHLCNVFRDLHFRYNPLNSPFVNKTWIDHVLGEFGTATNYLVTNGLGFPELREASDCFGSLMYDMEPGHSSLIHGDPSPSNILTDNHNPSRVAGFIDWDDSRIGDYMHDLANWATFNDSHSDVFPALLGLYHYKDASAAIHPSLWRRFWVYYTLISVTKLAHLHKLGYSDLTRGINRVAQGMRELRTFV